MCTKPTAPHSPDPIGAKSFLGFIRTIGQKKTKQNSGSQTFHFFGLRFDQVKADLFDRQGRVLRANVDDCMLNPHSISQALRSAGADLDHRENRLLKLSWRQQTLTLCYANGLGVEARQVFTPADLYNLWVHQFKQRSKQTGAD